MPLAHAHALPRPVAAHSTLREGVIAGAIGATSVAVLFLIIDMMAGQPLRTPEVLGRALLSILGPAGTEGPFTHIFAYTLFHYTAFAAVGILATIIVHWAEREPSVLAGFLILFVAVEIGFYGLVALLSEPGILGALAWYQVLLGNLIAAGLMGWYLWHAHPALGREFDHALSGRE